MEDLAQVLMSVIQYTITLVMASLHYMGIALAVEYVPILYTPHIHVKDHSLLPEHILHALTMLLLQVTRDPHYYLAPHNVVALHHVNIPAILDIIHMVEVAMQRRPIMLIAHMAMNVLEDSVLEDTAAPQ